MIFVVGVATLVVGLVLGYPVLFWVGLALLLARVVLFVLGLCGVIVIGTYGMGKTKPRRR